MGKTYTMYHCHTDRSLLDSCTKPQEYIDLAVKNGQKALAFSEHGKPLSWVSKKMACDKAGIKYMHAVEIYLTEQLQPRVRDNYHTVLIAKNWDGVLELNRLVSKSCDKDHFYYTNRISFDEFLAISDNIISTSACLASPLNKLPHDHQRYMELAKKYSFLEVQPHLHPDQVAFNQWLYELSQQIGVPLIVGTDTHSSSKYKAECRAVLLSAKHKTYGDEDAFDLSYKTYDELVALFKEQGALPEEVYLQALENTNVMANMVEDFELDRSIKYPILYGSPEEDERAFTERVERMFKEKVDSGVIPPEQVDAFRMAIDEEMAVFHKIGMMGFMGSMSELICWCKEQGMAIGTARGSVGGSRVAYVTDIIDLNPEQWRTVFSRFANEDRVEIGDIDIDCVESDRPAIFKHITDRFGSDHTARVASFGTMQDKGVADDVGRHLSKLWAAEHDGGDNPWSLARITEIKKEFAADPEATKKKYPEIYYYYDGLIGTYVSQSVHSAGMVISPITLNDTYGVFDKDGDSCLMLDMDEAHDVGLAKYDFLVLKTVQVIRDCCAYLGKPYPKTYEVDWDDPEVWEDMVKSPSGIFQFEGDFAFNSLRRFQPHNIFDMSLVTACIRPSGASYRDEVFQHISHKNPSEIIDDMLSDSYGRLVYQEQIIKFLQDVCGLTGSQADSVRRGIAKKKMDLLEEWMPVILNGYCSKSDKPRDVAEQEAKEFLKVIEDSSSYMFGYNHSVAYCLLGYLCAYYRHYHPLEFLTSFLNNAANDDDISSGTAYAEKIGVRITMPKWGISRSTYSFDSEKNAIAKGLSSIKYMSERATEELYNLAHSKHYDYFVDLLYDLKNDTTLDARQLDILIKIEFFSEFGNQRELNRIVRMFDVFKSGDAKKVNKTKIDGTPWEDIVKKYATGLTKTGSEAKFYTLFDTMAILREAEEAVKSLNLEDISMTLKVQNVYDALGYMGYVSGNAEDRRKLYVSNVIPRYRRKDGKLFGYSVFTKSIGSGKEAEFTVYDRTYRQCPIKERDIIYCSMFSRNDRGYFILDAYTKLI